MYIFFMIYLQFLVNFNGQFCNTQLSHNPPLPTSAPRILVWYHLLEENRGQDLVSDLLYKGMEPSFVMTL